VVFGLNNEPITLRSMNSLNANQWYTIKVEDDKVAIKDDGEITVLSLDKNNEEYQQLVRSIEKRKILHGYSKKDVNGDIDLYVVRAFNYHLHSGYSLLDGFNKISAIVKKSPLFGSITDHGVLYGTFEFYKKMISANKKPVLGCEVYCERMDGKLDSNHLIILAKNYTGWKNLVKLVSNYNHFYSKPHITYEMLEAHKEGLIVTSACIGGEIPQYIFSGETEKAEALALKLKNMLGDDFYIEIQRHNIEDERFINPKLEELANKLGIKIVAANDAHFTNKEDKLAHDVLLCLQTGKTFEDSKRMSFEGEGFHIYSEEEFEEIFEDKLEYLDNTIEIAKKCSDFHLETGKIYMPEYDSEEKSKKNMDSYEFFDLKCQEGFNKRFSGTNKLNDKTYIKRLRYEIDIIKQMRFPDYFLIVWDFVKFAKDNGIMVGPGRGSAAGSLVAYCLEITDIDPIPLGLLFERFLNPERVTMPDIDIDFEFERRSELFDYVKKKYGEDRISKIVTFGTFGAKTVVKDVGRVMGKSYELTDKISKMIPFAPKMTLDLALAENPDLKTLYDKDKEVNEIINLAKRIEGLPRHCSIHACGVIIAPSSVTDFVPQVRLKNRKEEGTYEFCTQYTMGELEEMGLLKMDFLGLKTMGIIGDTLRQVGKQYEDVDIYDKQVYKYISKGDLFGVFQLESSGMSDLMKKLFKDVNRAKDMKKLFERIIAGISLYRPGPMDSIPDYVEAIARGAKYELPQLKSILEPTYGQIVYQEQVMQIVRDLAGYSMGRSDLVRRGMAKKKASILEAEKEVFINGSKNSDGTVDVPGCVLNKINEDIAGSIWDKMAKFAEYAFNKSHAAGYAVVTMYTAYLKYYHPKEFMCSILNAFINNTDKLKIYINKIESMGMKVLPPDINKSQQKFSVEADGIRVGLEGLKQLGAISREIINERNSGGTFKSIQDFLDRMITSKLNKGNLESLIHSGALDNIDPSSRRSKIKAIVDDEVLAKMKEHKRKLEKKVLKNQISFFDLGVIKEDEMSSSLLQIPNLKEYDIEKKLAKEKEYTGLYISDHPLNQYRETLKKEEVFDIGTFTKFDDNEEEDEYEMEQGSEVYQDASVKVAGIIGEPKTFFIKRGKNIGKPIKIFPIEDKTGQIKCVAFTDQISIYGNRIAENNLVIISGKIKVDDFGTSLIIENITPLKELSEINKAKSINVQTTASELQILKEIVNSAKDGDVEVVVHIGEKKKVAKKKVKVDFALYAKLEDAFGDNVSIDLISA
jgi:DNA polymerase III subunit alpha